MESWASQSLSSTNTLSNNLKSSEQPKAKEPASPAAYGEEEPHSLLSAEAENTNGFSLYKKCNGIMGVPITYMDKHCVDQFDIIWQGSGNTRACAPADMLLLLDYRQHKEDRGGCAVINNKRTYGRIFIRRRR